jgi:FKBP-type peptidyl-prolyl cis-trans isomerase SlyD
VAYVAEVGSDEVVLDFNHPLADETLYFHAKVSALRPATAAEMTSGCGTSCGGCSGGCGA